MSDVKLSAADVKRLRDATGAGMMDCKKALVEAAGDFDKAIEVLRKKGQKLSVKRADREAKEGVVIAQVSDDMKKGIIVKLSCETDFVAKNEDFVNMTKKVAQMALDAFPGSKDELLDMDFGGLSLRDKITEYIGVIGEKVELTDYETLEAPQVVKYIHMGNKAGVLVAMNKADDGYVDAGRDVAMQVAAMKPIALSKDSVPQEVIDKELEIGKEIALKEGKPEAMVEKIAMGKLNRFFKDNTLLAQLFVKDSKKTVEQYLQSFDPELTITDFKHVKLG